MNKLNSTKTIVRALIYQVLLLTMIGCDGGLFGTGDGGDIVLPPDGVAVTPDVNPGIPDVEAPNEPAAPTAPPGNSDNEASEREFQNLLVTGSNELALITLINASSQSLNVVSSSSTTPLLNAAVEPGLISEHVELVQNQSSISIIDSDSSQPLLSFSSFDTAASTVTMLVAYDTQVPTTIDTNSQSMLDVIALRTLTSSSDPSVATLRIVQASQLGTSNASATMTLVPNGSNPGSGEVIFDNISLSNALNGSYMSVNAGTYQLQDSLGRFDPVPLSLETATVYSLIIRGTTDPVLIIAEDSNVVIQSNAN